MRIGLTVVAVAVCGARALAGAPEPVVLVSNEYSVGGDENARPLGDALTKTLEAAEWKVVPDHVASKNPAREPTTEDGRALAKKHGARWVVLATAQVSRTDDPQRKLPPTFLGQYCVRVVPADPGGEEKRLGCSMKQGFLIESDINEPKVTMSDVKAAELALAVRSHLQTGGPAKVEARPTVLKVKGAGKADLAALVTAVGAKSVTAQEVIGDAAQLTFAAGMSPGKIAEALDGKAIGKRTVSVDSMGDGLIEASLGGK